MAGYIMAPPDPRMAQQQAQQQQQAAIAARDAQYAREDAARFAPASSGGGGGGGNSSGYVDYGGGGAEATYGGGAGEWGAPSTSATPPQSAKSDGMGDEGSSNLRSAITQGFKSATGAVGGFEGASAPGLNAGLGTRMLRETLGLRASGVRY